MTNIIIVFIIKTLESVVCLIGSFIQIDKRERFSLQKSTNLVWKLTRLPLTHLSIQSMSCTSNNSNSNSLGLGELGDLLIEEVERRRARERKKLRRSREEIVGFLAGGSFFVPGSNLHVSSTVRSLYPLRIGFRIRDLDSPRR